MDSDHARSKSLAVTDFHAPPQHFHGGGIERKLEFTAFYRAEIRRLVGFVMKLGATEHEAADAAQAALTQAWIQWDVIHTNRHAWIRTVATREFYQLRASPELPHAALPDRPILLSPDALVEISERTKAAQELLNALPPMQRLVLAWKADGFSAAEIARNTPCATEVAVRKNLQRACATLRAMLAEREGETP